MCFKLFNKMFYKIYFLLKNLIFFLFLIFSVRSNYAEKIGTIKYKGNITELNNSTIFAQKNIVGLSPITYLPGGKEKITSSSIFFIIDHSSSMYMANGNDIMGHRFRVTRALIDTLSDPEKYPGVECGLAVLWGELYYDDKLDTNVFDTLPDSLITLVTRFNIFDSTTDSMYFKDGGYIPLMKLDKKYETNDGRMKGTEIIQKYLETKLDTNTIGSDSTEYINLVARNDPEVDENTNIEMSFRAAINTMKSSKHSKDNQFIIFLSDGQQTTGYPFKAWTDYEFGYILDGDSSDTNLIPTTFTIFFTDSVSGHPASLDSMNGNIKKNGYSNSNIKYTQLWDYNNSTEEKLLKFMMDNIFSVLGKKQVWQKIKIDGIEDQAVWLDSLECFSFPNIIPLLKANTSFHYTITYKLDSIQRTQDKLDSIEMNYDIVIDPNLDSMIDTFQVYYWERSLSFFHNGQQINVADKNMKEIEIRFTYEPNNGVYKYTKVQVEVISKICGDRELFTLNQDDPNQFSCIIKIDTTGENPIENDGIVQQAIYDTLVATFKNQETPKLLLDTLSTNVIFNFTAINNNSKIITEAQYFNLEFNSTIKQKNDTYSLICLKPKPENTISLQNLSAEVKIYDALSNEVLPFCRMDYDSKINGLKFLWDCKNINGVFVGNGSYLCVIKVHNSINNRIINSTIIKGIIGVKKD